MQQNAISRIENLTTLKHLTHLYLQRNCIERITGLDDLSSLRKLYLGMNKIRVLENLGSLGALCELHVERQNWTRSDCSEDDNDCSEFTVDELCIEALSVRIY